MNILITAATTIELQQIKQKLKAAGKHDIEFYTTGIGCTSTTFALAQKFMHQRNDLIINTGIAGSFNKNIGIGEVTVVQSEIFGSLGVTYPDRFATLFDEGLLDLNTHPFTDGKLICSHINKFNLNRFKPVKGLTVDAASGEKKQTEQLKKQFCADIETMEGAAFFYTCMKSDIELPFLEFRAISNHVEPRDKSKWNIPLALNNLACEMSDFINSL